MFEAIGWPDELKPSGGPIHFTNELEVAASPATVWPLLTDPAAWPKFFPGVRRVDPLDGRTSMQLETTFETSLAGQDVSASVQQFEPVARIARDGGPKAPKESVACHAWIITPTTAGSHLWTEETMRGPPWIEPAGPAPDVFWRTHEKLLADLGRVAVAREGARSR